jgi:hypothetical protein
MDRAEQVFVVISLRSAPCGLNSNGEGGDRGVLHGAERKCPVAVKGNVDRRGHRTQGSGVKTFLKIAVARA